LSSLCWNGAEEAGCQACVQHSLQVREVVVVEEAGCQACERLSLGERVHEEVRTPGRGPVAATELGEFWSDLLLKPKAREV
jgi:hypothetical protein